MLTPEYLIGLTMAIVEVVKTYLNPDKVWLPLIIVFVGAGLNAANAAMFGGDILVAIKEGIQFAVQAAGLFSLGKTIIEGSPV